MDDRSHGHILIFVDNCHGKVFLSFGYLGSKNSHWDEIISRDGFN
jgi:hypothetical protein